jgi:hypothetical protein
MVEIPFPILRFSIRSIQSVRHEYASIRALRARAARVAAHAQLHAMTAQ